LTLLLESRRMKWFVFLLPILLSSCVQTTLETEHAPGASLRGKRLFYVERHPDEDWGFHQTIADEITMMGYKASAGEPNQGPAGVDAIVTYVDKWHWDVSPYMFSLDLRILDPKTRSLLVKTRNVRPSLVRRNPKQMAQENLRSTFGLPEQSTVWIPSTE
jgi:hypothetical protein